MKSSTFKICEVCHQQFRPDRRVGDRQRVCDKLSCQKERKRGAQQSWVKRNPDYFKDRYWYVKDWLTRHPDYLKNYRASKKMASANALIDIQDELIGNKIRMLNPLQMLLDIQDEITRCFNNWITRLVVDGNL